MEKSFPVSSHLSLCCLTPFCLETLELDKLPRQELARPLRGALCIFLSSAFCSSFNKH